MITLPKIYNVQFVAIIATLGGMLYVMCPELNVSLGVAGASTSVR